MHKILGSILSLGLIFPLGGQGAFALPGQSQDAVAAWIEGHPTLQPAIGDGLIVRRSNTAAQRFTFEASVFPVGAVGFSPSRGVIRTESFSFYDQINGVSFDRLQESLRIIYGVDIEQDYAQAEIRYTYPSPQTISMAQRQNLPLLAARTGELRVGYRFAYWVEILRTESGRVHYGQMTVFDKADVEKMETELRSR